jgi:N-acetylglucosamine kinase-like BadF-type ATPase
MKLLVDSGSTKAAWAFLKEGKVITQLTTKGINPYQQEVITIQDQVRHILEEKAKLVKEVFFYGSGITPSSKHKIESTFHIVCPQLIHIEVQSDIVAAARSLCQHEAGIACILGTGSNSCLYNGEEIVANIGGFGFILGDDGSGAVLGKQLLSDFLHHKMPSDLHQKLQQEYELTAGDILEKVYRAPYPNRFLASFSPFLLKYANYEYIHCLISSEFRHFFLRKVLDYPNAATHKIHFTGSIAFHFKDKLFSVTQELGLQLGSIEKAPMDGLIHYHLSK